MAKVKTCSDGVLMFWCPGCNEHHGIHVDGSRGWSWNGLLDQPTIRPSILVRMTLYGPERKTFGNYNGPYPCESAEGICHSYVEDGRIRFLKDSTHPLKGQTVDMPEIE